MKWVVIPIEPRFYEIDSYQIVNNMFYLSWFEMGRFAVAEKAGLICDRFHDEGLSFVVKHIDIEYKKSVLFRDKIKCETIISLWTAAKLVFNHRIRNAINNEIHSEGHSEVILLKKSKMQLNMPVWVEECINKYLNDYQEGLPI
ncbi:thioesterase family protein [Gracilinema caldarium]|uniref:acyl-CoA thioesterase n=1 Tax=Gracilinema caldarium TaxID=215591 RepID=UPI0026EDC8A1|nr:acyl-CoA thioesterase [Gracilinema caldarium]